MYVWLFLSNLAFAMIFAFSWYFGSLFIGSMNNPEDDWYYNHIKRTEGLRNALFAFLLIYSFTMSILNMYTICLVTKYGCCFLEGSEAGINNRTQNNGAQALQVIPSGCSKNVKIH